MQETTTTNRATEYRDQVWDANYRVWECYAASHGACLDLASTADGKPDSPRYAFHRWLRNSIFEARHETGETTVYLLLIDRWHPAGRDWLPVEMCSATDAAKLYEMARAVMGPHMADVGAPAAVQNGTMGIYNAEEYAERERQREASREITKVVAPEFEECPRCEELYLSEDLSDQCGCGDDGSGCYVTDLPEAMCDNCHEALHEGPDEYDY